MFCETVVNNFNSVTFILKKYNFFFNIKDSAKKLMNNLKIP